MLIKTEALSPAGPLAVFRMSNDHYPHPAGAISLVNHLFDYPPLTNPHPSIDGSLDVFIWHVSLPGFIHGQSEGRVLIRVSALPLFDSHPDHFRNFGKNFTLF